MKLTDKFVLIISIKQKTSDLKKHFRQGSVSYRELSETGRRTFSLILVQTP